MGTLILSFRKTKMKHVRSPVIHRCDKNQNLDPHAPQADMHEEHHKHVSEMQNDVVTWKTI